MAMPSAGDFVIYGTGAAEGHVSFIPEHGSHAGPSAEEMNTFIVYPAKVTLPASITHPAQLYEHFMRYRLDSSGAAMSGRWHDHTIALASASVSMVGGPDQWSP